MKTGMLDSTALVRTVVEFLGGWGAARPSLVVDPVMVATSGARLLRASTVRVLEGPILPLARLATPNLDEARVLTGIEVREPEDLRRAARILRDRFGCAALIKGGHLPGRGRRWMCIGMAPRNCSWNGPGARCVEPWNGVYLFGGHRRVPRPGGLALPAAVRRAKEYITESLRKSERVARHRVLGAPKGFSRR